MDWQVIESRSTLRYIMLWSIKLFLDLIPFLSTNVVSHDRVIPESTLWFWRLPNIQITLVLYMLWICQLFKQVVELIFIDSQLSLTTFMLLNSDSPLPFPCVFFFFILASQSTKSSPGWSNTTLKRFSHCAATLWGCYSMFFNLHTGRSKK